MNIAFQAFVLICLALPGIILRRVACRAGKFREKRDITEEFTRSFVWSACLNAVWVLLFDQIGRNFLGLKVDLSSTLMLSMGQFGHEDAHFVDAVNSFSHYPWHVLSYFLSLYVFSMLVGIIWGAVWERFTKYLNETGRKNSENTLCGFLTSILKHVVHEEPGLRRCHEWIEHLKYEGDGQPVCLCAMIVNVGTASFLYVGRLEDDGIIWAEDGTPDRFLLRGAVRRRVECHDEEFHEIRGDLLIVKSSELITLNIWWTAIDVANESAAENPLLQQGD